MTPSGAGALERRAGERPRRPRRLVVGVGRALLEHREARGELVGGGDPRELAEEPGALGRLADVVRRDRVLLRRRPVGRLARRGLARRGRRLGVLGRLDTLARLRGLRALPRGHRLVGAGQPELVAGEGDRGHHRSGGQDGPADGVDPGAARGHAGHLCSVADGVEGVAGLDVRHGVGQELREAGIVVGLAGVGHDLSSQWTSSRVRRAADPRDAWLFTAPRLIPRVSAISASDRSR